MAKRLDASALLEKIVVDLGIEQKTIALFYITMILIKKDIDTQLIGRYYEHTIRAKYYVVSNQKTSLQNGGV
jgi:hypothetical protein